MTHSEADSPTPYGGGGEESRCSAVKKRLRPFGASTMGKLDLGREEEMLYVHVYVPRILGICLVYRMRCAIYEFLDCTTHSIDELECADYIYVYI